jgi:hypothetical protein
MRKMNKIFALSKKVLLAALVILSALAFLPAATASAEEGTPPAVDPARVEEAYAKLLEWYNFQTGWMSQADSITARTQNLINEATARGYDASAVQSALDAFGAAYPNALVYNQQAGAIVAGHAGFDESGAVTDLSAAIQTVRSLQQALKTAHDTMNGTGQALRQAIRTFIDANKPQNP